MPCHGTGPAARSRSRASFGHSRKQAKAEQYSDRTMTAPRHRRWRASQAATAGGHGACDLVGTKTYERRGVNCNRIKRIFDLERNGHPTTAARELLEALLTTQTVAEQCRDMVAAELQLTNLSSIKNHPRPQCLSTQAPARPGSTGEARGERFQLEQTAWQSPRGRPACPQGHLLVHLPIPAGSGVASEKRNGESGAPLSPQSVEGWFGRIRSRCSSRCRPATTADPRRCRRPADCSHPRRPCRRCRRPARGRRCRRSR